MSGSSQSDMILVTCWDMVCDSILVYMSIHGCVNQVLFFKSQGVVDIDP